MIGHFFLSKLIKLAILVGLLYLFSRHLRRGMPKDPFPKNDEVFLEYAFALFAKMAVSDQGVLSEEIAFIERVMADDLKLDKEGRARGIEAFRKAKSSSDTFESIALKLKRAFPRDRALLENLLEILILLALADGEIQPAEDLLLARAAEIFNLKFEYQFMRQRIRFYREQSHRGERGHAKRESYSTTERTRAADDPYQVLGLHPGAPLSEVKKKYRKLALEHHPDRLAARGLPKEFSEVAARRFRAIQGAYEKICGNG